jgi:hypothetical protein
MPIDQATANSLTEILRRFREGCQEIANLLPNAPAQPAPTADRRIEILQKNFAEVSNYDRHYSTTRSALTVLLVTVGLALAVEPLKSLWGRAPPCSASNGWDGLGDVLYRFPITLLLFLLTVPVNFYFRRLTFTCAIIERAIEREIAECANLQVVPEMALPPRIGNLRPPVGYYFRFDLYRVSRSVGWPRLDEMTMLLLFAVLEFIAILFYWEVSSCTFWRSYFTYGLFAAPVIIGLALLWMRRGRATVEDAAV